MSDLAVAHLCRTTPARMAQPERAAFHYCLALMMAEAGKARLVEIQPSP